MREHSYLFPLSSERVLSWPPWYSRDVWQVQGGWWGEDILEVLGARFLEAMERGVGVVLGQPLIIQTITRQRHRLVLGQRHADDLSVHLLAIQVAHCFGHRRTTEVKGRDAAVCQFKSTAIINRIPPKKNQGTKCRAWRVETTTIQIKVGMVLMFMSFAFQTICSAIIFVAPHTSWRQLLIQSHCLH